MANNKSKGATGSTGRKAARGANLKGSSTLPASTNRKQRDRLYTRRAVAMGIGKYEKVPWRTSAIPTTSPEQEEWVRSNPATAEDIFEYVRLFSKSLPKIIEHGIKVNVLMVFTGEDMRTALETICKWAEKTAYRMEPHVLAGKSGLAAPFADLHVITQSVDMWIDRHDCELRDGV